jgi:hypothetical protein
MDGWVGGLMGGWMDGSKSRFKDCLQQSKTKWNILKLQSAILKKLKFLVGDYLQF